MVLRVDGDFSKEETLTMLDAIEARFQGAACLMWLTDLSAAGTVASSARKVFAERMRALPNRGSAFLGADFRLRMLATLMTNVLRLMGRPENPARFFDSEAAARAWLDERRREVAAAGGR